MNLEIRWTLEALSGLQNTIEYLHYRWTENEINNFQKELEDFIQRIKNDPFIYPMAGQNNSLRKGLIDKNNFIVYEVNLEDRLIEIITLRSTKQKPLEGI